MSQKKHVIWSKNTTHARYNNNLIDGKDKTNHGTNQTYLHNAESEYACRMEDIDGSITQKERREYANQQPQRAHATIRLSYCDEITRYIDFMQKFFHRNKLLGLCVFFRRFRECGPEYHKGNQRKKSCTDNCSKISP